MLIGVAVTALIIFFKIRERLNQQKHDLVEEPMLIFVGRNVLIALGFLLFSYLLSSYRGLPNVLVVMFALIVLYAFVASNTTIGRRIYALGGNEKAARLSGIRTHRLTFYAFLNMGVLAALAGLVFTARLNSATPQAGLGFELDVIAACLHRRRLADRRRRQDHRGGHRRLHRRRHEQRHVDPRHRHRLAAGHQGPGPTGRRLPRRLLQAQSLDSRKDTRPCI